MYLKSGDFAPVISAYRALLCCIGQKILVVENGTETPAVCDGINGEGHLLVTMGDGSRRELQTGEISIRI